MKFLLFIYSVGAICFFDNKSPDPATFNDTRPRAVLLLTGFNPGSRVYFRYWEGNSAYTYPSNYAMYIDAAGKLQTEIVLSLGATSADVLVYVDQSGNGKLDALDFGIYQSGISINAANLYTYLNIAYQANTLTAYNTITPLPASGQNICIYMPAGKPAWSSSLNSSIPEYPYDIQSAGLSLNDWFPVSVTNTASIVQSVPLITALGAGAFNETCVNDANSNGIYDVGEVVGTSSSAP